MSTAISSRLVVLGGCGAWPEGGRACSGFVLEHDGYRVVLDLGYGTLPRLLALLGSVAGDGIDAVIVTHQHPDHMADLHGLFRARWFGHRGAAAIPLYAPDGVLARTAALEDDGAELLGRVFRWHPLPAGPYQAGPFRLESVLLPHWVPNAGIRLTAPGLTVAYTGDTGPDPALPGLGRNADLYLVDATSRESAPGPPPGPDGPELLLNARAAGRAAAQAGARRLLLTHFWPGSDRAALAAMAAEEFGGRVLVADEGLEIALR